MPGYFSNPLTTMVVTMTIVVMAAILPDAMSYNNFIIHTPVLMDPKAVSTFFGADTKQKTMQSFVKTLQDDINHRFKRLKLPFIKIVQPYMKIRINLTELILLQKDEIHFDLNANGKFRAKQTLENVEKWRSIYLDHKVDLTLMITGHESESGPHVVPNNNISACQTDNKDAIITARNYNSLLYDAIVAVDFATTVPLISKTADQWCEENKGKEWAFFVGNYSVYGDNVCHDLICYGLGKNNTIFTKPVKGKVPDGMRCGKYKTCYKGKCEISRNGDGGVSDNCPWGDQDLVKSGLSVTCKSVTCFGPFLTACCDACARK